MSKYSHFFKDEGKTPEFFLPPQRNYKEDFFPSIRIAKPSDSPFLIRFYKVAHSETEEAAKAYAKLVLSVGRTYIADIGGAFPFIASAITVLPTEIDEKHLVLPGTIPFLRGRGLMRDLLKYVMYAEKEYDGIDRLICRAYNQWFHLFLYNIGFKFPSLSMLCDLSGRHKGAPLHMAYRYQPVLWEQRIIHLGYDGFSCDEKKIMHSYFRAKGGYTCQVGDGHISFMPNYESKGKYIITECAVSAETLTDLPSAFETCLLPYWYEPELRKKGIECHPYPTATATFDMENRFVLPFFGI